MNIKRLAIDLAKEVFQLYGVDDQRKIVLEKRLKSRKQFIEFITKLARYLLTWHALNPQTDNTLHLPLSSQTQNGLVLLKLDRRYFAL